MLEEDSSKVLTEVDSSSFVEDFSYSHPLIDEVYLFEVKFFEKLSTSEIVLLKETTRVSLKFDKVVEDA